jgi:transposase-like protein
MLDTGGMSQTQEERRGFWRRLVAQQEQSGLSVRAFCRQHHAKEHSFYQWRKRLSEQHPMKFALVEAESNGGAGVVELLLATGERLRISPGADAATLRAVLGVLREQR